MTIEHIDNLTNEDLARMPSEALRDCEAALLAEIKTLKTRADKFKAAKEIKYAYKIKQAFLSSGKDTGTVNLDDDGIGIKVEVKKTVKWDQELIYAALETLPKETAKHYAKVSIEIDERKYVSAPPDIQELFNPARTLIPSNPTITFKAEK